MSKSAAVKDIDDISISLIFWGHKYRYRQRLYRPIPSFDMQYSSRAIAALIVVCHLTVVMCTAADDVTGWAQTDEDLLVALILLTMCQNVPVIRSYG